MHTRSILSLTLASTLAVSSAVGQTVTSAWRARTTLTATAVAGTATVARSMSAGTDLSHGSSLAAEARLGSTRASADLRPSFRSSLAGISLELREIGTAQAGQAFGPVARALSGTHETELALRASTRVPVRILVSIEYSRGPFANATGPTARARVTLPGVGSVSILPPLRNSVTREFVTDLTPSTLNILTQTGAETRSGTYRKVYSGTLTTRIRVVPARGCRFEAYGSTCGPSLTGSEAFGGVTLDLRGAFPSSVGLLVLGMKKQAFRIPRTTCWLWTELGWMGAFTTDENGEARFALPVLALLKSGLNVQIGVFRTTNRFEAQTTRGLRIDCD